MEVPSEVVPGLAGATVTIPGWNEIQSMASDSITFDGTIAGAVLLSQYGKRWTMPSIHGWFAHLNAQRGAEARHLHPHLFRHSIAVHLLQRRADVRYIQQFLGHGSLDTTKIYLRLVPGRLKEDYDRAMPEIATGLQAMP